MQSIGTLLPLAIEYLSKHGIENPRREVEQLLCHTLDCDRLHLYTEHDKPLQELEVSSFREKLKQKAKHVPLAHLIGQIPFYNILLKVNQDVLIPRVETEQLVQRVADSIEGKTEGKVLLDLCTGSGCIGISLKKKFPELRVILSDVCEKALAIAKENAKSNDVEVEFLQGNFLDPLEEKVDFVVSNPPYVTEDEYQNLEASVKDFEPKKALVASDEGLYFYKELAKKLPAYLNPKASVWLEIGSTQGEAVKNIFNTPPWKEQSLLQDLSQRDRIYYFVS